MLVARYQIKFKKRNVFLSAIIHAALGKEILSKDNPTHLLM